MKNDSNQSLRIKFIIIKTLYIYIYIYIYSHYIQGLASFHISYPESLTSSKISLDAVTRKLLNISYVEYSSDFICEQNLYNCTCLISTIFLRDTQILTHNNTHEQLPRTIYQSNAFIYYDILYFGNVIKM